jgi:2-aminomuconate deaminase
VILKAAGGTLKNLLDITVFLVDMKDYAAFNIVYNKYFDAQTGPTRTTVAVKELPNPRLLIEIKAVAALE